MVRVSLLPYNLAYEKGYYFSYAALGAVGIKKVPIIYKLVYFYGGLGHSLGLTNNIENILG